MLEKKLLVSASGILGHEIIIGAPKKIAQNLAVALRTALPETLAALATT